MRKRTVKISLLALILAFALVFSTSCTYVKEIWQSLCTHPYVLGGDCNSLGYCAACGKSVGTLADHRYQRQTVYPDCTDGGYVEYVCSVCGDSYREDATDPKGHTYGQWIFDKEPTADDDGIMYRECSVCGARETETVPAHEHNLLTAPAKAHSCTEDGWDGYEYCTLCEFSTRVVIPATGHSYGEYVSNGNSTHTRVCQNDPSHVSTEPCSGGDSAGGTPVCAYCHSEYEFATREGNSAYGYEALGSYATYGDAMQRLYRDFTETCERFATGGEDLADKNGYYVIGEYDLANYGLSLDVASAVWKVFYVSSPVYYWLDAKVVSIGDTFLLTVADDYARAVDRREADAAILAMTEECALLIDDTMTELERAVTITEYIVTNMQYAYEKDGTTPVMDMWAHCMAGFAMPGLGVCEAYAKTFMYLCLLNGVDCRMGSGYAGEPHAWNYVKIDGEWYGADLTWTDNSGDTAVYDYFGLSSDRMFAKHTPHSSTEFSGSFIYEAPTLSSKSIELASVYKNGEYYGLYKSIDEAFAAMTDSSAEYELRLDYYGFFTTSPMYTIDAELTPKVKKLTVVGKNSYVGGNHLDNNSIIRFSSSLTLGSDVEMRDLHLLALDGVGVPEIKLASHKLTLSGNVVYMDLRITGTTSGSTVVVSCSDVAYVYGGVDVHRLVTGSVGIMLGADSRITYCEGRNIYIPQTDNPADKVTVTVVYQR